MAEERAALRLEGAVEAPSETSPTEQVAAAKPPLEAEHLSVW